jgi:four helix bundle protein
MVYKQFEDLPLWIDARKLVRKVYDLTSNQKFSKDYGFKDQIQRASISIMNNIAEGFERDGNTEFIRFLAYSKGSAGEVRSMLYIAFDLEYIEKNEFKEAHELASSIIKQISNFIKYLKSNK